jgi:diguanylate cyclase (GGDEF)-like protein
VEFLPKKERDRSRLLYLGIGLFLLLDLSVLATSYWLSYQIAENAVTINLSGRQRMLSQRMVKTLLQLKHAENESSSAAALAELRLTFTLFDSTLYSLHRGGVTIGGDSLPIRMAPIRIEPAQELIEQAETLWSPYRDKVQALLHGPGTPSGAAIDAAIAEANANNLELLELMNSLTTALEESAVAKTSRIRMLQIVTFTLAMLSFIHIILLMRRQLRRASKHRESLNRVIHKINAGILVCDENNIIQAANQSAGALFGYDSINLIGMNGSELLILQDNVLHGRRQDGSLFHAEAQYRELTLNNATVKLKTVADVSQQRSMEKTLSHLAYHDALTGLPNRLLFDDRLQQSILSARRRGSRLAMLFVDLDKFKQVNDNHGHHIGDLLLKEIGLRLRSCLREEDTVSRFGGDEFGILLNSISDREDCIRIVTHILETLRAGFVAEGIMLFPDASIGIGIYPDDGQDEKTLLRCADQAMYTAKRNSTGHFAFYANSAPVVASRRTSGT